MGVGMMSDDAIICSSNEVNWFLYESFISHTNYTINLENKVKGKVLFNLKNVLRGTIFELEMVGGRVIWEEGRGTRDKMGHMAGTHPTVIEDVVTSHE